MNPASNALQVFRTQSKTLFELCDISDLVYNRTTQLLNGGLETDNRTRVNCSP